MDGLMLVLIIIGLSALSSSKKKKKAQDKASRKAKAFREAGEAIRQAQEKVPFSKDEWTAFLKEQASAKPAAAPAKPRAVEAAKPKGAPIRINAAKPVLAKATEPVQIKMHLEHDEPEGSVSTQGESRAEHAAHIAKIRTEEEHLRQMQKTLQEVRSLNRQKLQNAVVMSEILDKPVSLRRRANYH